MTLAIVGLLAASYTGVAAGEYNSAAHALNVGASLRADGMYTLIVEATNGRQINADDCLALGRSPGIESSVALAGPIQAHLYEPAGPLVPTWLATGPLVRFAASITLQPPPHIGTAGAVIDVDSTLGAVGSHRNIALALPNSPTADHVDAVVYDLAALGDGFSGNALIPATSGSAAPSFCMMSIAPDAREASLELAQRAFPSVGGYSAHWALSNADKFQSGQDVFDDRPSQWGWVAVIVLMVVVYLMYLRLRRSDLAVYAANGMNPTGVTFLAGVELAIITIAALVVAAVLDCALVWHYSGEGTPLKVGEIAATRAALGSLLVVPLVALLPQPSSIVEALKDR